jgi:hypothetical protein
MIGARRAIVRRTTIAVALAVVVLTGTTATGGARSNLAAANTLHAVVESTTPLTLELTTSDGGRVRSGGVPVLAPGTYTVVVEDRSSVDNFHLGGPGLDEQTRSSSLGPSPGRSSSRLAATRIGPTAPAPQSAAAIKPSVCASRHRHSCAERSRQRRSR